MLPVDMHSNIHKNEVSIFKVPGLKYLIFRKVVEMKTVQDYFSY